MKIDSVITTEVKTREEELEELLAPDGELNRKVYAAVMRIRHATTEEEVDKHCGELDEAINKYMQYAIEWDRLKRSK